MTVHGLKRVLVLQLGGQQLQERIEIARQARGGIGRAAARGRARRGRCLR